MFLSVLLVTLVALEQLCIAVVEIFFWDHPRTQKLINIAPDDSSRMKPIAANLGLYNAFLGSGLLWGLVHPTPGVGLQIQLFFLICVMVAAMYASLTVHRMAVLVQGLPALLATILVLIK